MHAKDHVQIMLLFVYTTTHKRFVIFTCGTAAANQIAEISHVVESNSTPVLRK